MLLLSHPMPTSFPMIISSNLNPPNSRKPFTMNPETLLNMAKTLTFSTHKRIKILFQPCTTYKWIDNHYVLSIIVTSITLTTMKLVEANVALVASNNTSHVTQPCPNLKNLPTFYRNRFDI